MNHTAWKHTLHHSRRSPKEAGWKAIPCLAFLCVWVCCFFNKLSFSEPFTDCHEQRQLEAYRAGIHAEANQYKNCVDITGLPSHRALSPTCLQIYQPRKPAEGKVVCKWSTSIVFSGDADICCIVCSSDFTTLTQHVWIQWFAPLPFLNELLSRPKKCSRLPKHAKVVTLDNLANTTNRDAYNQGEIISDCISSTQDLHSTCWWIPWNCGLRSLHKSTL